MIRRTRSAAERGPDDIVDDYLANRFGAGLEQVLLDGVNGHVTAGTAGVVTITAQRTTRWPYSDGGVTEYFEGKLTIEGVAYGFRCETYSVPDAYVGRFLTNVAQFEPIEWSAGMVVEATRA